MNDNTCVCCGAVIPEGRMICEKCYRREWMIDRFLPPLPLSPASIRPGDRIKAARSFLKSLFSPS